MRDYFDEESLNVRLQFSHARFIATVDPKTVLFVKPWDEEWKTLSTMQKWR